MVQDKLTVLKIKDSAYGELSPVMDEDLIYCELEYERDRSSFAGIALKVTNQKSEIEIRECPEQIVKEVSKYEKLYIGCDEDYSESIKEVFLSKENTYGIEVVFLVYSDVRSSQIIFEELMNKIDKNISEISSLKD